MANFPAFLLLSIYVWYTLSDVIWSDNMDSTNNWGISGDVNTISNDFNCNAFAVQHLCGCHYGSCIQLKDTSQITQLNAVDTSLYDNIFIRYSLKNCGESPYTLNEYCSIHLSINNGDSWFLMDKWGNGFSNFPGYTTTNVGNVDSVRLSFRSEAWLEYEKCCIDTVSIEGILSTPTQTTTIIPAIPSHSPTNNPTTMKPSISPTLILTNAPTLTPSIYPTNTPTINPTKSPSISFRNNLTNNSTTLPTINPSISPTVVQTANNPTSIATLNPTPKVPNTVQIQQQIIRQTDPQTILKVIVFVGILLSGFCCVCWIWIIFLCTHFKRQKSCTDDDTAIESRANVSEMNEQNVPKNNSYKPDMIILNSNSYMNQIK